MSLVLCCILYSLIPFSVKKNKTDRTNWLISYGKDDNLHNLHILNSFQNIYTSRQMLVIQFHTFHNLCLSGFEMVSRKHCRDPNSIVILNINGFHLEPVTCIGIDLGLLFKVSSPWLRQLNCKKMPFSKFKAQAYLMYLCIRSCHSNTFTTFRITTLTDSTHK